MGGTNKRVVCPFYIEEPSCANMTPRVKAAHARLMRKRIRCEGICPGGKIYLEFGCQREKEGYLESFCYTNCWQGCPVAIMLLMQYDAKR